MQFRIADFEVLTRHYVEYINGINNIESEKGKFIDLMDPIKVEMNEIISYESNVKNFPLDISDSITHEKNAIRFQELQQEIMKLEGDFKVKLRNMTNSLNEKCYDDISEIINKWGEDNSIDIIIGKMEVIYNKKEYDITDIILDIMKEKNMFLS